MGKVRAVANGNILDENDVNESLITAGVYERISDDEAAAPAPPAPEPEKALDVKPAGKGTKVEPLTTVDMPKGKRKK